MLVGQDTKIHRGEFPHGEEYVVQHIKPNPVKVRNALVLRGVQGGINYMIHNNSATNLRRALMERVFNVEVNGQLQRPPQPIPGIYRATLLGPRERIAGLVGRCTPVAREDFVQSRPVSKRKLYQNALASLQLLPVNCKDARVEGAFVKCEKINQTAKPDPAPRIIQPRNPRYNIEVGRYLSAAEHKIYHAIDKLWDGPTVIKGYNVDQIGEIIDDKWRKFTKPAALGLDASRFDQHVSVEALAFEHGLYNEIFGSRELAALLRKQLDNKGTARADNATFQYRKKGSRMSGDMNTALGNVVLMCILVYRFCEERGVKASLVNNGDDCTVICEERDVAILQEGLHAWFLRYGFNIVEEPVRYVIEEIEFCQMHPVLVNGKYKMVRNFWNSLSKDAVSIRSRTPLELKQWLHCVGMCGLAVASGVPVQQEYYELFVRNGVKGKRSIEVLEGNCGLIWYSKGLAAITQPISDATRVSFYRAFGVDAAMQYALEAELRVLTFSFNVPQTENNLIYRT